MERVYVGLGTNLGDREAQLRFALTRLGALDGITLRRCSSLYETAPVGPPPQGPYLNAAVELASRLGPRDLLDALLQIEVAAGRHPQREGELRWGPRVLDLDLLFYGSRLIDSPGLTLPHPRLHERAFVLEPLAELAPDWIHPGMGLRIDELAARVRDAEAVECLLPPPRV